jgi:hypothetical protein
MVAITVSQAASTDGNEQVAADTASGTPCSFSVSSVMIPSVPSEPTISRVRSYPAELFRARAPVTSTSPDGITAFSASTLSFIVP